MSEDKMYRTSNSEVATFLRCRRKWMIAYGLHLKRDGAMEEGPLWVGTVVHIGHDARFKALKDGASNASSIKCCFLAIKAAVRRREKAGIQLDYAAVDLARIMLEGYWEWEAEEGVLADYEVLDTEREMEMPVVLPTGEIIIYLGKADVVARSTITDFLWVIDKKTVSSLLDPSFGLQRNTQMLGYIMLLERATDGDASPTPVEGAIFSMLRKVKRTAKANPPFYGRVEVRYNKTERLLFKRRLVFTLEDMMALRDKLTPHISAWEADGEVVAVRRSPAAHTALVEAGTIAYPTPNADCSWDCAYVGICDMFNDGSRIADAIADNFVTYDPLERYDSVDGSTQKEG